jgi:probable HAF family extracellular repeat protein
MKMNIVKQWSLGVTVVGAIAVGGISRAQAFKLYTITNLGDFGGEYTYASDINDSGEIVGNSTTADGNSHAFRWQNGTITDLGTRL